MKNHQNTDTSAQLQKTAVWTFFLSFAAGTLLFLISGVFKGYVFLLLSFYIVLFTIFLNAALFINNIIYMALHRENRRKLFLATLLLLVNIPVAYHYYKIIL